MSKHDMKLSMIAVCIVFVFLFTIPTLSFQTNQNPSFYKSVDIKNNYFYKERTTNEILFLNVTDMIIINSHAYYILSANLTRSMYLPLLFRYQNMTFQSVLVDTIIKLDKLTGIQIAVSEKRIFNIPELNLTNLELELEFGSIDAVTLVKNQAYSTQLIQKNFPFILTLKEKLAVLLNIINNSTLKVIQSVNSQFMNSLTTYVVDTNYLLPSTIDMIIDEHEYNYALVGDNSIFNRNLSLITSTPSFEILFVFIALGVIYFARKKK